MKKLWMFLLIMLFALPVFGEEIRQGVHEINLTLSGTTTALNKTAVPSGISWFVYDGKTNYPKDVGGTGNINQNDLKLNMGVYSVQLTAIPWAISNQNAITLTSANGNSSLANVGGSGATIAVYYQMSNEDRWDLWAGSGVTLINNTIGMVTSGASIEVLFFYPGIAKHIRLGVLSGMTQFGSVKGKLIIQ